MSYFRISHVLLYTWTGNWNLQLSLVEVLTPIVEQMTTVKEFINLRWTYESIYIVPLWKSFWSYPLLKVSGWMVQWYPKSSYDGSWVSKISDIWLIYQGYLWFVSFEKRFCFWSICRLFHLVFTKNIHKNSVGNTLGGDHTI